MRLLFNTALFDEVKRDKSGKLPIHQVMRSEFNFGDIIFVQWIGLVGGTMGLLTGLSILSVVEIFYFGAKLLTKSRKPTWK